LIAWIANHMSGSGISYPLKLFFARTARMQSMDSIEQHPDESISLADGRVFLFLGARLNTPAGELDADRMTVEYDRGNNDEVLVFKSDGNRTIMRVRLAMTLSTPSPAISASASWSSYVEEIPEQQKRQRLLAIYDHFTKRSFPV
jgi:hypothetical protein